MTVVRNKPHSRNTVGVTERHNERKNETYSNIDVIVEQSHNNIYFKKCENTYLQTFDKMVEDKIISVRGLQENAHIMGEMIFDVNTRYFEDNGGYDFAKKFYEDAHDFAVNLVGDERYIISSVMHADERNKALTDEFGKDVFHYHLHIVYVPIVEKEVYFSKRSKDKAGQLKEVINQVSHSKKWRFTSEINDEGERETKKSYSKLQDDFWEHMRSAGYQVERGEKGSTAENLTAVEYKVEKETERLAEVTNQVMRQMFESEQLAKKLGEQKKVQMQIKDLENIGKKAIFGDEIKLTPKELKKLKRLARNGIELQNENAMIKSELNYVKTEYNELAGKYNNINSRFDNLMTKFQDLQRLTQPYIDALNYAGERVKDFVRGVLGERKQEQQRTKKQDRGGR